MNYDAVGALYYLPHSPSKYKYAHLIAVRNTRHLSFLWAAQKRRNAVTIKWPQKILPDSNMCHWLGLKCEQQEARSRPQCLSNSCNIYSEKPVISSRSQCSSTLHEHTHTHTFLSSQHLITTVIYMHFPVSKFIYYADPLTCPSSTRQTFILPAQFYSYYTANTLPRKLLKCWRLQNRPSHSHCEICRWPCARGYGRNGSTGYDK